MIHEKFTSHAYYNMILAFILFYAQKRDLMSPCTHANLVFLR